MTCTLEMVIFLPSRMTRAVSKEKEVRNWTAKSKSKTLTMEMGQDQEKDPEHPLAAVPFHQTPSFDATPAGRGLRRQQRTKEEIMFSLHLFEESNFGPARRT